MENFSSRTLELSLHRLIGRVWHPLLTFESLVTHTHRPTLATHRHSSIFSTRSLSDSYISARDASCARHLHSSATADASSASSFHTVGRMTYASLLRSLQRSKPIPDTLWTRMKSDSSLSCLYEASVPGLRNTFINRVGAPILSWS